MRVLLSGVATSAIAMSLAGAAFAAVGSRDLPPNAAPGHCYGKVQIPAQYETYTEQVVQTPARTERKIIPAVTQEVERQVVATEAYTQRETIAATYRTVTETVVVHQAYTRRITIPAVYETVTEQVLVSPARTEWRRALAGPGDAIVPGSLHAVATGEIVCLVVIPAEYRTITRQVLRQAESFREETVPAETTTVTRQVVDQPARVIEHQIPATYKTVRETTVVQPERTEIITLPAVYGTVTKQRLVAKTRFEWREVICRPEGGAAPAAAVGSAATGSALGGDSQVRAMQLSLQDKGYYKGPVDGLFSPATQDAMVSFQRASHLPEGRLTDETARALGLR